MAEFKDIKNRIVSEFNSRKLCEVLPSIIDFAQRAGDMELKQLCVNELYGYAPNVELPKYRNIPVTFYDKKGNKIRLYPKGSVLSISEAMQKENYPFRAPIEELENMAVGFDVRRMIVLRVPFELTVNGKTFVAHSFEYFSQQIKPSVSELRRIINSAIDNIEHVGQYIKEDSILNSLHEDVVKVSSKLFIDGHYRSAVLDAMIELVNRVKLKSKCTNLDNTPLMERVFSSNKPILEVSDSNDIQQGVMRLYSGAVMAFRNANAHKLDYQITRDECIEQLYFISYLHRTLDKSQLNTLNQS